MTTEWSEVKSEIAKAKSKVAQWNKNCLPYIDSNRTQQPEITPVCTIFTDGYKPTCENCKRALIPLSDEGARCEASFDVYQRILAVLGTEDEDGEDPLWGKLGETWVT